ncbi:MAG: hypothetical protein ACR2ND_06530 [Solirubrobacteraceae bacterium]
MARLASEEKPLAARSPHPVDARLRAVWEAIQRPDIQVISTDVFDTLVWRQVAEPQDAFRILGERLRRRGQLAARMDPAAFQTLRRAAELEARRARSEAFGELEVNLEEIYAVLPDWVFGHPVARHAAKDAELALEHELVVPDLDVAAVLQAAAHAGKRVIAVSDTYFSESEVRALLDQPGLLELDLERVFVSCKHRRAKADGLFGVVLRELDVPAAAVVHLGDSKPSDIEPARAAGILAIAYERHPPVLADLLQRERRFVERAPETTNGSPLTPELTSLRGKVAARWEGTGQPPSLRPFWEFGALVMGPVLTGFADWIQKRAAEHRLSRLFCFMREGHFLIPLVDRAGQALELPARAEPLWLNREVLSVTAIGEVNRTELATLLVRRHPPTLGQFLSSLGLGVADLPGLATQAETSLDDPDVRESALSTIIGDEDLSARILDYGRTQRERVVRYVNNLLDGDERMGVVDLGWGGTAQHLLGRTMWLADRPLDIQGFYLITQERMAPHIINSGLYARGFLAEVGSPVAAADAVTRTPEIFEQLCMPDHGPQMGLDEHLKPVLAPALHDRLQMAEAAAVQQGVEAFQREWSRYTVLTPGKLPSLADAPHLLRPLVLRQLLAPTPTEATMLGTWMHDENQGSDHAEAIADERDAERVRHVAPDQLPGMPVHWPAGLAARTDSATAALYAAAVAGELEWQHVSSELETGPFVVEATGVGVHPRARIEMVPKRNRLGLSAVSGHIAASEIHQIVLRPALRPCVLRFDYLKLSCHVQGNADPISVELTEPRDFLRLSRNNCFVLSPNVYVVHKALPELRLDLTEDISRTIFRVDVRIGIAVLPISQILTSPGRLRSVEEAGVLVERLERNLSQVTNSLSWRITRPLRIFKRFVS